VKHAIGESLEIAFQRGSESLRCQVAAAFKQLSRVAHPDRLQLTAGV
jgi:hypothetical protein